MSTINLKFSLFSFRFVSYEQLVSGVKKFDSNGVNSVKYEVRAFERKVLYTWFLVDVKHESVSDQNVKKIFERDKIVACVSSFSNIYFIMNKTDD